MEQKKLKQLLSEMSLREKIGQMIQLTGIYFDDDAEKYPLHTNIDASDGGRQTMYPWGNYNPAALSITNPHQY